MNTFLMFVALVLMLISTGFGFKRLAQTDHEDPASLPPRRNALFIILMTVGLIVSFGGFWIEALLWGGIIVMELGCIAYFAASERLN